MPPRKKDSKEPRAKSKPATKPAAKKRAGNKPNNKSTQAIFKERVAHVMGMLSAGAKRNDILLYNSKNWNVSDRQVQTYIAGATANIEAQFDEVAPIVAADLYDKYVEAYKRALSDKRYSAAIKAADSIARLTGAFKAQKIEVTYEYQQYVDALVEGQITAEQVRSVAPQLADEIIMRAGLV